MSTTEALQRTLAAEHAALWAYGLLGGRTSQSASPELYDRLTSAYLVHRRRRDEIGDAVVALGEEPVGAGATYDLPGPADTEVQVRAAALALERRCAETYAALVAESAREWRRWAVDALSDAAGRELGFGGSPTAFPGAPELG